MSKETKYNNRHLLEYIRKGLALQEDFTFCVEGYQVLLDKTEQMMAIKNKNLDENTKFLIKEAFRVNDKIKKWKNVIKEKIPTNPEKYLPLYFFKWLGIEYLYSLDNLNKKNFNYMGYTTNGIAVSHSINSYLKKIKQVKKATNQARNVLLKNNEGLIYQQAQKVAGDRKDILDDLISVAYYQFIKCMDRTFNLDKGIEFSTYVVTCMFHKCKEAKTKYDEIIRIPTARLKDKTLAAKGELDLNATEIEDEEARAKEVMVRHTISNSNLYWSLDRQSEDEDGLSGATEKILSDNNQIAKETDNIIVDDIIKNIINKILTQNSDNLVQKKLKIKALEYSGALDFENETGERNLKSVVELLYNNGYTKNKISAERARQLILEGKELIKKQILRDPEFMETLGVQREGNI